MDCTADESKAFKDKMGIKGFPSFRVRLLCLFSLVALVRCGTSHRCHEQI